jgi:hypothetical protein
LDPKYYQPSTGLVEYLNKELQALQPKPATTDVESKGEMIFIRSKEKRRNLAKNKKDYIDRIFQAFSDIVYFLEFIEDHHELHDIFERGLKDLFGVNKDPYTRNSHYQNRGGTFERLIRASLMIDSAYSKGLDFRVHLIKTLIELSITAMRSRINDINEMNIMEPSVLGIWSWGKLLSSRVPSDTTPVRHALGFYPIRYTLVH